MTGNIDPLEEDIPILDIYAALPKESVDFMVLSASDKLRSHSAKKHRDGMNPQERKEYGDRISKGMADMPEEYKKFNRKARSAALVKRWAEYTPEEREVVRINKSEAYNNMPESSKRNRSESISKTVKASWDNLTSSERSIRGKASLRGLGNKRVSFPELILGSYLESTEPGKWTYNGKGVKGFRIGNRIPDFIDYKGKRLMEAFGSYTHRKDICREDSIISFYKARGWDCSIMWEDEIYALPLPEFKK